MPESAHRRRPVTSGSNEHFAAVIDALVGSGEPYRMDLNASASRTALNTLYYCGWMAPEQPFTSDVRGTVRSLFSDICNRLDVADADAGMRRVHALNAAGTRAEKLDLTLELPQMCAFLTALHYAGFHAPEEYVMDQAAEMFGDMSVTFGIEAV